MQLPVVSRSGIDAFAGPKSGGRNQEPRLRRRTEMNIYNLPATLARVMRCVSVLAVSLALSTAAFAQPAPGELLERLKPVTLPVKQVHRDPNAVASSCPAPESAGVSVAPAS